MHLFAVQFRIWISHFKTRTTIMLFCVRSNKKKEITHSEVQGVPDLTMTNSMPLGRGQTCPSHLTWGVIDEHSSIVLLMVLVGVAIGILITLLFVVGIFYYNRSKLGQSTNSLNSLDFSSQLAMAHAEDCRRRLPDTIILIRHGESEANADKSKWIEMPDNLLGLTSKGHEQAARAGQRVEEILQHYDNNNNNNKCQRVHLVVSPFERSLQTAAALRLYLEYRIVRTDIESRIREQEMGNLQNNLFQHYRQEQQHVGRFWYRFPTGESGSDVLDRVKSWWYESVLTVNTRVGYEPVQAMVVVSHGMCVFYCFCFLTLVSLATRHCHFSLYTSLFCLSILYSRSNCCCFMFLFCLFEW
jgi:broad specificity phosphatase PhoE